MALLDNEVVLRNGGLRRPVILTGCQVVGGHLFCKLNYKNDDLIKFLYGISPRHHPLSKSALSRTLVELRDERLDELFTPCSASRVVEEDVVDDLGLGEDTSSTTVSTPSKQGLRGNRGNRRTLALKRAVLTQHPTVTIDLPVGGDVVRMRVIAVMNRQEQVSFEAIAANFDALREWCCLEDPNNRGRFADDALARRERFADGSPKIARVSEKTYYRQDSQVTFKKRLDRGVYHTSVTTPKRTRFGVGSRRRSRRGRSPSSDTSCAGVLADQSSNTGGTCSQQDDL